MHGGQTAQEQVTSVKLRAAMICFILLSSSWRPNTGRKPEANTMQQQVLGSSVETYHRNEK